MTIGENRGENCSENWELCIFRQFSFHDMYCKARITALALPIRKSSSLSCLPLLVNTTPRYLNFSTCFSDTPLTCNEQWSGFLERWSTSVSEALIFIPALLHVAAKSFNANWRPDSVEESKTRSSANNRRLILIFQSRHTH